MDRNHSSIVAFLVSVAGARGLSGSKYLREMCYAAAEGRAELIARVVQNGVDPSMCLYGGRTPLHLAARHGQLKVRFQALHICL